MTTPADRIIILLAFLLLGWLYLHYWRISSQPASYAWIFTPFQPPQKVSLQHSQRLQVRGRLGESLIEIDAGRIRFHASPCPGKQCIHAGWLSRGGELVTCLPNQVSIELHSAEENEFDAIAY
jgi:hypothetical protein